MEVLVIAIPYSDMADAFCAGVIEEYEVTLFEIIHADHFGPALNLRETACTQASCAYAYLLEAIVYKT